VKDCVLDVFGQLLLLADTLSVGVRGFKELSTAFPLHSAALHGNKYKQ
jgi:hypothetical protein